MLVLLAIFAFASPAADAPVKIDVSQKIMQNMTLRTVQPEYPAAAASAGIAGPVVVAVTIGPGGTIADTKARCGDAALTQAALDAVKQYQFRPVAVDGKQAEVHGDVVVDFVPPPSANSGMAQVSSQVAAGHLVNSTVPKYPSKASSGNVQGCVVVQFEVAADGKVQKPKAVNGNPLLLKAAEQCVAEWTYKPFQKDGKDSAVQTYAIVEFSLAKPTK